METLSPIIVILWRKSTGLSLCEGNPPVTSGFPHKGPLMRSFDIFFDVIFNKLLNTYSSCAVIGESTTPCDVTVIYSETPFEQHFVKLNKTFY